MQRFVLANLHGETWVRADELARLRSGDSPSVGEAETVRRAVRSLARQGRVETAHRIVPPLGDDPWEPWAARLLVRLDEPRPGMK